MAITVRRMQRVVGLLVAALVLFWIIDSPTTAAATVTNILAILAASPSPSWSSCPFYGALIGARPRRHVCGAPYWAPDV